MEYPGDLSILDCGKLCRALHGEVVGGREHGGARHASDALQEFGLDVLDHDHLVLVQVLLRLAPVEYIKRGLCDKKTQSGLRVSTECSVRSFRLVDSPNGDTMERSTGLNAPI